MLYPDPNEVDESITVVAARAGRVALRIVLVLRDVAAVADRAVDMLRPERAVCTRWVDVLVRALAARDFVEIFFLPLRGDMFLSSLADVRLTVFCVIESLRATVFCVVVRATEFTRRSAVSP